MPTFSPRVMKKPLAAFVLAASQCLSAWAEPPSIESVETLFALMKVERLLDSMMTGFEQSLRQGMQQATAQKALTPAQKQLIDSLAIRYAKLMREELSWESLKPLQVRVYTEAFEQHEIDGLIAFYRSPVGQAFVEKIPLVTQRVLTATQERMKTFLPKVEAAMREAMAEAGLK